MDPLKRWQAEAMLTKHQEHVDEADVLGLMVILVVAVSPLLAGVALCAGWIGR